MRVFDQPRVILVARPSINWDGVEQLLGEYGYAPKDWVRSLAAPDGDLLPEMMGRLCYGAFGKNQGRTDTRSYIGNILVQGHGSVLEHSNWSFVACRASRGYTHQMVRHRAGFAYSQESTHFIRYDESEKGGQEPGFCATGLQGEGRSRAIESASAACGDYAALWKVLRDEFPADAKVKKIVSGSARSVLPNGMESRLGFTGNLRALRHFCEMRGTADNTLEVRLVAVQVAAIMRQEAPAGFQDVELVDGGDGWMSVRSGHPKV